MKADSMGGRKAETKDESSAEHWVLSSAVLRVDSKGDRWAGPLVRNWAEPMGGCLAAPKDLNLADCLAISRAANLAAQWVGGMVVSSAVRWVACSAAMRAAKWVQWRAA